MRIQGPNLGDKRRKFCWLPRKIAVPHHARFWTGEKPIPYFPGFHHSYPGGPSAHRAPKNQLGGMVHPVEMRLSLMESGWVWLEHILEIYVIDQDNNTLRGHWTPCAMPTQWSLWYEYG